MRRPLAFLVPAALLLLYMPAAASVAPSDEVASAGAASPEPEPAPVALRLRISSAERSVSGVTWRFQGSAFDAASSEGPPFTTLVLFESNTVRYSASPINSSLGFDRYVRQTEVSLEASPGEAPSVRVMLVRPEAVATDGDAPDLPKADAFLVVADAEGEVHVFALTNAAASPGDVAAPAASCSRLERLRTQVVRSSAVPGSRLGLAAFLSLVLAVALLGAGIVPPFAAAFFSRFDRSDVLDHPRRSELFDAVRAEPGVTFGLLCGRLGLSPGVAQHHLGLLEQHGLVRRLREGRTTRYHASGPRVVLAPLGAKARVLDALGTRPLTAAELSARMGRCLQTTLEHLRGLEAQGLVVATTRGRRRLWQRAAPTACA